MYVVKLVLKNILIVAILIVSFTNISVSCADETGKEALKEVNALRVKRGLRPFIFDANLTLAAKGAAKYRAENLIEGHCTSLPRSDFHFIPRGGKHNLPVYELSKCAAGCAAWSKSSDGTYHWGACCTYDTEYTYAGAYAEIGKDGRRYTHLFVRKK